MSGEAIQPVPGPLTDISCHPALAAGADFLKFFSADGPLLVALSGGSDSTALLHVFHILTTGLFAGAFPLMAATVDHGLRAGSRAEALAAADLCRRLGIPHRILDWTGNKPASGLQEAARAARYRLLATEARRIGASAILLGHNAGDQAETIAMRAARGAGRGLAGMAPAVLIDEQVWAFRPFLQQSRDVLRALLTASGLGWIDDPSNLNRRFERVRLRLDDGQEPRDGADIAGARLAHAKAEAEWLLRHVGVIGGAVASIDASALPRDAGGAEAAGLFRLAAAIGGRVHPPGAEARARMIGWLSGGQPGRATLGGTVFDRRRDALHLYRERRGLSPVTLPAGAVADGRYRLIGPDCVEAHLRPVADPQAAAGRLAAQGVPVAIARRAAPALLEVAGGIAGDELRLERIIAGGLHFVPSFDLPAHQALRALFALPPLPDLPVRQ